MTIDRFRRWFWQRPRPHGETLHGRAVTSLELYYDLVFVAVIIQLAHHLSDNLTARGLAEFSVVFTLVWIAWLNGSMYLEMHGRDDGRTRTVVFIQMGLLAMIAVFIADAQAQTGPAFAASYAAFLAVVAWLWHDARRERRDPADTRPVLGRYVPFTVVAVLVMLVSVALPPEPRFVAWTAVAVGWVVGLLLAGHRPDALAHAVTPTESLVERFGLFTIIVLGEVFFGVVNGLASVDRDATTIVTGMAALLLGFAIWWLSFDLVGRRLPRSDGPSLALWMTGHLPLALSIAAAGAAGVGLIEHAHDQRAPENIAWLVALAVAVGLLALIGIERSLVDAHRLPAVYRPVTFATVAAAGAALAVGWLRPTPWLLAVLLVVLIALLWAFTVGRFVIAAALDEA
jgi:low temperature requirement protein LtrA